MKFIDAAEFTAERAWGSKELAEIELATAKLHWTDEPYIWHVNDGVEVFAVLDGAVEMFYREDGREMSQMLFPGTLCVAEIGDEHVAHRTHVPKQECWFWSRRAASDGAWVRHSASQWVNNFVAQCAETGESVSVRMFQAEAIP